MRRNEVFFSYEEVLIKNENENENEIFKTSQTKIVPKVVVNLCNKHIHVILQIQCDTKYF